MIQKVFAVATLLLILAPSNAWAQEKPNVIIVITDDQGKNDLSCMGNPYIKTPNLDKFYEESVRFTNYHVSTTCAPTLASSFHESAVSRTSPQWSGQCWPIGGSLTCTKI